MAFLRREQLSITTDASGDATAFTGVVNGFVRAISYNGGFDATADLTITTDNHGQSLLTVTNQAASAITWHPRQATHATDGTASLYAAAGEPVESDIPIAGDRIKVVVAQGGNAKTGVLTFWVG